MKIIHSNEFKQKLTQKLYYFYIFLGDDFFLLKKNQDLVLNMAYKKGFLQTVKTDIEKNKDWEKIILFYKKQDLFFKKTILVVNFLIKKLDFILIKNIYKTSILFNSDILIILKFNHLSASVQKNELLNKLKKNSNFISCFTPYGVNFINWIQNEIQEKNINIEEKAFLLLCKYYEGNTLFINNILDILSITWPNTYITEKKIKTVIIDFFIFNPVHWINSIFQNQTKKAIYILNCFYEQKYNPLILIRYLQKDLLHLIYIKREKYINVGIFLEKNNIWKKRHKFFENASNKIDYNALFKAIKILVKIEISIKKKYNNSIWEQLKELTLILCY